MAPIFKIQAVSESGKANSGDKRLVVDLILTNILCQLPARHRADLDMRGAIRAVRSWLHAPGSSGPIIVVIAHKCGVNM